MSSEIVMFIIQEKKSRNPAAIFDMIRKIVPRIVVLDEDKFFYLKGQCISFFCLAA